MLHIDNLNAFFGDKQVLHNINIHIKRGRKTAIVGESGSGKTVLAQAIMRLNPDVRLTGELRFQQENMLAKTARQMQQLRGRKIGMVFQEPMTALNPVMMVGKQIAEVCTLHLGLSAKEAWQQAIDLLAETGIDEADKKVVSYPFQLSGGQRQRAMIAMAVAGKPELLIADEPTTALDVAVQAQILALLERLQREHQMTLLYITHDLNLVRRFADDVIVMQHGRVVEQGETMQIFASPQHEYTKMLLNAAPQRQVQNMPSESPIVLSVDDLMVNVAQKAGWFRTQQKTLLHPLSFDLKAGETLGIIGESGSGKTTLAKALLRLIDATGQVKIKGETWQAKHRQAMQMVFQDPFSAFNPRMTVYEIVAEPLRVVSPQLKRDEILPRVQATLRDVGLPDDILQRYPHEFSGGQRQRLAIARALMVKPQILVLDEPTSALDVQWQQQILQLLAQLQQQYGLSMLIISHDLAVIRALSHRVLVLQQGKVVEQGECETVFAKPNNEYTMNLLKHGIS